MGIFGAATLENSSELYTKAVSRKIQNYAKFTGKQLCQSFGSATLLKKRIWHRCFPVNFEKYFKNTFFIEILQWLLLYIGELRTLSEINPIFP